MPRTTRTFIRISSAGIAYFLCIAGASAFHGGHTGVTETQLKSACPAFSTGAVNLFDSVSPPGNLPMTDIFEHESGARCACTRMRTDKHTLRCGPTAAAPRTRG
jgi:hypothetical protein